MLFETIRASLSMPDLSEADFDSVVNGTDIMIAVSAVFRKVDTADGLTANLKGKALNVCVNLCMGSLPVVREMLEPKYGVLE